MPNKGCFCKTITRKTLRVFYTVHKYQQLPNKPKKILWGCTQQPPLPHHLLRHSPYSSECHGPRWRLHRHHFESVSKSFCFYKVWESEGKALGQGSGSGSLPRSLGTRTKQPTVPGSAWRGTAPAETASPSRGSPPPSWRWQPPRCWPSGPSQRRYGVAEVLALQGQHGAWHRPGLFLLYPKKHTASGH